MPTASAMDQGAAMAQGRGARGHAECQRARRWVTRRKGARPVRTIEDLQSRCQVDPDSGCWVWQGELNIDGSPKVWLPIVGRRVSMGVAVHYVAVGTAPTRRYVPLCGNRLCGNPEHRGIGQLTKAEEKAQRREQAEREQASASTRIDVPAAAVNSVWQWAAAA